MDWFTVNTIATGSSVATLVVDTWVLIVLWLESGKYCELPLKQYLQISLWLSFPASFVIHRIRSRKTFRLAFAAECLFILLSLCLLAYGTFLMTLVSMEICPLSSPLTWRTVGASLALSWSLICGASIAVVTSAAVGFVSCKNND